MKILIITQDEPFYLSSNLHYLINNLPKIHKIVGCIVSDVSPFGRRESFLKKAIKTFNIFGTKFFIYYSFKYLYSKIFKKPVRKILKINNISEICLSGSINSSKNLEIIRSYKPDLIISILGNQIFKEQLINLAPKGCINLHTAMLPKYRGLMPTFWVLKNNEKYTGVSVFYVDKGIDSGPIITQEKVKIENKTQAQLIKETKEIGMKLILKSIELINRDKVVLIPNPDKMKTYYTFPTKKDVDEFKRIGKNFF
jgi:methionyl-tRNA formyltransferase